MDRRSALQALGAAALIPWARPPRIDPKLTEAIESLGSRAPEDVARDETFWEIIQRRYSPSPHFVNLESGFYSPAATPVLQGQIAELEKLNELTSFYMRRGRFDALERLRRQVAELAGATPEEIALVRNTTEALNIVIHGLELPKGAEALMAEQEYPSMLEAFEQRHRRYGLRLRKVSLPPTPESLDEIVELYRQSMTPDTKVVLISYMVFLNGQILPVKEICELAHEHGAEVIVDAAHAFAHVDFEISELGCDYLGTSLHKWLGAPLGNGLLYVRRDKIPKVWPLLGDTRKEPDDIRKFEHLGTHSIPTRLAIAHAARFHESIGGDRKEARLRYLKNRWTSQVKDLPGISFGTPLDAAQSCAIASFKIEGQTPRETADRLFEEHDLFTVGVKTGVRVAPNLHCTLKDLDRLAEAIRELSRS